jgi:bacterioferritin-associated ferredoxin
VLVCHCHVVDDAAIRAEIEAGALSADELADRCGAGSRCGGCHATIEAMIELADAALGRRSLTAA